MDVLFPLLIFSILGVGAVVLCSKALPESERRSVTNLLFAGLGLRMSIATLFQLFPQFRIFHEDASGYEGIGMMLANYWSGYGPPLEMIVRRELTQNYGYPYVTAAVYFITGPYRVGASYLNCLFGTLTAFLVFLLARRFVVGMVATRALALVVFTPSMVLWSAVAVKEPVVTFFIVLAMLSCVKLKERFSLGAVVGIVVAVAAIQPLRFYIIYFLAFAIFGSLLLDRGLRALTGFYKQLFLAALGIALFAMLGLSGSAQQGTENMDFEYLNRFRQGMAVSANSGFARDVDISTPGRAIAFLPIAVPTLLLAPFPWQMTSLRALIAAPETIAWWCLVPATLRGLRFMTRRRFGRISPILLFSMALTGMYSLMHGNVGSAFRQRAQIFVFLFIFSAIGLFISKCRRAGIDPDLLLEQEPGDEDIAPVPVSIRSQAAGGGAPVPAAGASSAR